MRRWRQLSPVWLSSGTRYSAGIYATDALEQILVVVTADHGEMLGDHWMMGKSGFFRDAFHVPLASRDPRPGSVLGRRVEAFSEHVDLMPTILGGDRRRGAAPGRRL